jgi:RND family efflux transporter MFP subunit
LKRTRTLWLVLLSALVLAGCGGRAARKDEAPLVKVVRLQAGSLADEVAADGQVKAVKTASVTTVASGRVTRIAVKVGDRVEQGQPLVWIEDPLAPSDIRRLEAAVEGARVQLESARITTAQSAEQKASDIVQGESSVKVAAIEVQKAQASLGAAQTELTRKEDLLTKKAIAQTDVEKARLSRDQAQADLHSAQVRLASEKEKLAATKASLSVDIQRTEEGRALASLRQAEADLESALAKLSQDIVQAPISGRVAERNVQLGQDPSKMSTPLMTIIDESALRVEARFDERYAQLIRPGLKAEGRAVTEPDVAIPLVVDHVTPQSRQSLLTVELRPTDGTAPRLTAETYVRVRLELDTAEGILVPLPGLMWSENGTPAVMIVHGHTARKRSVTIVEQDESQALLKPDDAIKAGELLIVEGQTGLADGARVTYQNE